MANIAYFNVNIYAIETEMKDTFLKKADALEKGKYCIEFNFDQFRVMRTSAQENFKWPKEYLHAKYTTEYPQHLDIKVLTVRLVKPSVFGFSDKFYLNPAKVDLETIATGIMRYKAELSEDFAVSFILEMTQISDVSIELRNIRYTITDKSSFRDNEEYVAELVYEPGGSGTHARELRAFTDANLVGEEMESYREKKEAEIKALKEQKQLRKLTRTPVKVEEVEKDGKKVLTLTWPTIHRILIDDVSFRDLYYSKLYIGIKQYHKDKDTKEMKKKVPFIRCTKIPISRCLVHNSIAEGQRTEGAFPGDEDKIVHLTGVLEGSIYLNDIPYYTQVFAPDHYVRVPFEDPENISNSEGVTLMLGKRGDPAGTPVESVPTEFAENSLNYRSKFVRYGVPYEAKTPSVEDEKSEATASAALTSSGSEMSETDKFILHGSDMNCSTGNTLTKKLLE